MSEQQAIPTQCSNELSDRDAAILDFERQWFKYAGAKALKKQAAEGVGDVEYIDEREGSS